MGTVELEALAALADLDAVDMAVSEAKAAVPVNVEASPALDVNIAGGAIVGRAYGSGAIADGRACVKDVDSDMFMGMGVGEEVCEVAIFSVAHVECTTMRDD